METKHTLGPWFTDQYGHVYGWIAKNGNMESVTLIDNRHSQANRFDKTLISVAPEILEALKDLSAAAAALENAYIRQFGENNFTTANHNCVAAALAVIKKAI